MAAASESRTPPPATGSRRTSATPAEPVSAEEVDAVMAAARVLVGVIAASVAEVDGTVTAPQLRVLVLTASRGPWNVAALAEALQVHASNATRTVDRLVQAGLLLRRESPADRRHVELTLTRAGRTLVRSVMEHRSSALGRVLEAMPARRRRELVPALLAFAEAAGEPPDNGLWPDLSESHHL